MAGRIRTIKPELLEDERAALLSDAAWRLFVSSWLLADDHGRFRAGARYLAASVWQDTTKAEQALEALLELARAGRVRVYQVDGQTYAEIPTWTKHQRIDNAAKARIPLPSDAAASDSAHLDAVSPRTSANLRDSREVAALPPTSDLRPPTSTTDTPAPAGPGPSPGTSSPTDPATDRPQQKPPTPTELVFAAYIEGWHRIVRGTRPPALDDKRRKLIAARLRDFPLEDLLRAVCGIWSSAWHLEDHRTRISLEIALRDAPHVERFRDLASPARGPSISAAGPQTRIAPPPRSPMLDLPGVSR